VSLDHLWDDFASRDSSFLWMNEATTLEDGADPSNAIKSVGRRGFSFPWLSADVITRFTTSDLTPGRPAQVEMKRAAVTLRVDVSRCKPGFPRCP
jgi:hypothetical protein